MSNWVGPAAWSAKEARAGDRLPYARLVDESTLLLRDGSVMTAIQVPGLLFETEDSEALNAHAATREVMLRSTLDARFVLYHHVIRRRVTVELDAEFPDPISRHIDARWKERLGSGQLFVNDQFITLIRRPARGKAGLVERVGKKLRRHKERLEADPKDIRSLRAAAQGLIASLQAYGALPLGEYAGVQGSANSEILELLSALYNGEMRPVRKPADDVDIGLLLERLDRVPSVVGGDDHHVVLLEHGRQRKDVAHVVVHDEDPLPGQGAVGAVERLAGRGVGRSPFE